MELKAILPPMGPGVRTARMLLLELVLIRCILLLLSYPALALFRLFGPTGPAFIRKRRVSIVLVSYLTLSCTLLCVLEDWSLLDAVYHMTATMTTIGCADWRPKSLVGRGVESTLAIMGPVLSMAVWRGASDEGFNVGAWSSYASPSPLSRSPAQPRLRSRSPGRPALRSRSPARPGLRRTMSPLPRSPWSMNEEDLRGGDHEERAARVADAVWGCIGVLFALLFSAMVLVRVSPQPKDEKGKLAAPAQGQTTPWTRAVNGLSSAFLMLSTVSHPGAVSRESSPIVRMLLIPLMLLSTMVFSRAVTAIVDLLLPREAIQLPRTPRTPGTPCTPRSPYVETSTTPFSQGASTVVASSPSVLSRESTWRWESPSEQGARDAAKGESSTRVTVPPGPPAVQQNLRTASTLMPELPVAAGQRRRDHHTAGGQGVSPEPEHPVAVGRGHRPRKAPSATQKVWASASSLLPKRWQRKTLREPDEEGWVSDEEDDEVIVENPLYLPGRGIVDRHAPRMFGDDRGRPKHAVDGYGADVKETAVKVGVDTEQTPTARDEQTRAERSGWRRPRPMERVQRKGLDVARSGVPVAGQVRGTGTSQPVGPKDQGEKHTEKKLPPALMKGARSVAAIAVQPGPKGDRQAAEKVESQSSSHGVEETKKQAKVGQTVEAEWPPERSHGKSGIGLMGRDAGNRKNAEPKPPGITQAGEKGRTVAETGGEKPTLGTAAQPSKGGDVRGDIRMEPGEKPGDERAGEGNGGSPDLSLRGQVARDKELIDDAPQAFRSWSTGQIDDAGGIYGGGIAAGAAAAEYREIRRGRGRQHSGRSFDGIGEEEEYWNDERRESMSYDDDEDLESLRSSMPSLLEVVEEDAEEDRSSDSDSGSPRRGRPHYRNMLKMNGMQVNDDDAVNGAAVQGCIRGLPDVKGAARWNPKNSGAGAPEAGGSDTTRRGGEVPPPHPPPVVPAASSSYNEFIVKKLLAEGKLGHTEADRMLAEFHQLSSLTEEDRANSGESATDAANASASANANAGGRSSALDSASSDLRARQEPAERRAARNSVDIAIAMPTPRVARPRAAGNPYDATDTAAADAWGTNRTIIPALGGPAIWNEREDDKEWGNNRRETLSSALPLSPSSRLSDESPAATPPPGL